MSESIDVVKLFYSSIAEGKPEIGFSLFDEHLRWSEAPQSPYFARDMVGVEAVTKGVFASIAEDFSEFSAEPKEFLADGSRVVAIGAYAGRTRSGVPLDAPFAHVWTVADGKLVEFVQFTDTALWREALARGHS